MDAKHSSLGEAVTILGWNPGDGFTNGIDRTEPPARGVRSAVKTRVNDFVRPD